MSLSEFNRKIHLIFVCRLKIMTQNHLRANIYLKITAPKRGLKTYIITLHYKRNWLQMQNLTKKYEKNKISRLFNIGGFR